MRGLGVAEIVDSANLLPHRYILEDGHFEPRNLVALYLEIYQQIRWVDKSEDVDKVMIAYLIWSLCVRMGLTVRSRRLSLAYDG